jgi:drug/metabolite transporter (DMT)-like permease
MSVMGFLMITLSNGLVSRAEVFVDSGIAAIICSLMPILVILFNLSINRSEIPNGQIVIGAVVGLGGILLIFNEHLQNFKNPNYTLGICLIFVATVSWAAGSILVRKVNQNSNLFQNAGFQMIFGGVWCLPLSFLFDDLTDVHWTSSTIYSIVYLSIFGSAVAYVLYYYAISKLPMTIASLYSYINPLVAVVLGSLILDEKLNLKIGLAFMVTVAGIYIVNRGYLQIPKKSEIEKIVV